MAVTAESTAGGCSHSRSQAHRHHHRHYLAKTVLRGSAVLHAVSGHIRFPSSLDIVFGKETSLELVVIGEDGVLESVSEQSVFGIIRDLAILKWNEEHRESTPQKISLQVLKKGIFLMEWLSSNFNALL